MNTDDKNRHFVLLIIDISKHGAKEMGHVKMAGPGFHEWCLQHDDPVLFQFITVLDTKIDKKHNAWYASKVYFWRLIGIVFLVKA